VSKEQGIILMNLRIRILVLTLAAAASIAALAQPQPPAGLNQNFSALADQPATHTSFSFDRSLMQIAQNLLLSNGMDPQRSAAALTGISVDTYHYPQPAFYTPEVMGSIINSYHAAGWKHMVNGNQSPQNSAQPHSTLTDLWLHFNGGDIDDLMVLIRAPRDMNVIQVTGDLRPMDLLHLSGHFGIPKVDPNAVMVPAPR
jgi:hypothetical protein